MWSPRQRRSDPERPPLPAGDAPQRSPSPRYTTTGRGLESGPPRVAEIPPPGAGEERGDATLPPCASARLRGYVTNARALERAAPVAARGRRFPARRGEGAARPRPRPRRPVRPALGARGPAASPPYLSPAGQAAEGRGGRLLLPCGSVTASPGRRGPARAPAARRPRKPLLAQRLAGPHHPPQAPRGAPSRPGRPIPASNSAAARAASSPPATRLTGLALRGPRSAHYPGRAARTPHTASPPRREGSRPGRGAERRSRCGARTSREGSGLRRRLRGNFQTFPTRPFAEREERETALGRKVRLRTPGSRRLLGVGGRETTSPTVLCALGGA